MTVYASKPEINVREKLKELDKTSGIAGEAVLRSETIRDAQNVLGVGRKNILINSQFHVNQRNENVTSGVDVVGVNNKYLIDRWNEYHNGGITRRITVTNGVELPNGMVVNSHKTELISGSANWLHPVQQLRFEKWMYGTTFTVSTWVKTNFSGNRIRVCDTLSCYLLGPEIPADGEWHYVTGTITFPKSGLTESAVTQWHPAFGGVPDGAGSYIEFALMQVEVGEVATPFEFRSYQEDLALCQRYYIRFQAEGTGQRFAVGYGDTGGYANFIFHFPEPMYRNNPTLSHSALSGFTFATGSGVYSGSSSLGIATSPIPHQQIFVSMYWSGGSPWSGTPAGHLRSANGTEYIAFDAEVT